MGWQKWDDNELGMMEAVVTKMSRIIAHVSSGEKGSHVLHKLQVRTHCHRDTCSIPTHPFLHICTY